jgi:uncharacterized protein (TIGR02996 family)
MHEEAFIRSILADPKDDVARQVYADWLEERGETVATVKAEFLRLTAELAQMKRKERDRAQQRLRELAGKVDARWLAVVSRLTIENCTRRRPAATNPIRFDFICERGWQDLRTTRDRSVRFCDACHERVYYCGTLDEARGHAWAGHCVAVDLGVLRRPGDLAPPTLGEVLGGIGSVDEDASDFSLDLDYEDGPTT